MRRTLVDVNVLLDAVLERKPHAAAAARIWAAVETGRITGLVPAHAVTTLFYLFAKARGSSAARRSVGQLLTVFGVAPVNQTVLQRALILGWTDLEDAVCAAAAEGAGCDLIVTRDAAGFRSSPVRAVDPAGALALLDQEADRVGSPSLTGLPTSPVGQRGHKDGADHVALRDPEPAKQPVRGARSGRGRHGAADGTVRIER